MTPFPLDHPLWQRLSVALIHSLWQGAVIAGLLLLVVRLFDIRRPTHRYTATLVAFGLLAVSPLATFALIHETSIGESSVAMATGSGPVSTLASDAGSTSGWHAILLATAESYFVPLWIIGVTLLGSRLFVGVLGVRRFARKGRTATAELNQAISRIGVRLGLRRLPTLRLSTRARDAMAIGFFRPVVVLPLAWTTAMPPDVLEAILAHELAHIRRHDLWINLLQRVVETLLFHHPAVWWLSRRLRQERELCCDELAVMLTGAPLGYARALEHVARWRVDSFRPALATGMGGTRMALLDRVRHVLKKDPGERRAMWPAGIVALGIPLVLWLVPVTFLSAAPEESGIVIAQADGEREGGPRDGDRERGERGDRERGDRERGERGDRERGERERGERGDRERGDRPPRGERERGDRPPRGERERGERGDRPPRGERGERPPRGDRRRPGAEGDVGETLRQLRHELEELRREVRALRENRPRPPFRREGGPPRRGGDRPGFRPERPDGDFGPRGPRDGEGRPPRGPRDGEGPPRRGPRDGEGRTRGPRDGDRPGARSERDGDRPRPERERDGD